MALELNRIRKALSSIFQGVIKNLVSLGDDSTLESDFKPLKVGDKNTPIEISETDVKINGSQVITEKSDIDSIDDLSDVTYSSGDLTITSLDKIVALNLTLEVSGETFIDSGDAITIDSGSGRNFLKVGGTTYGEIGVDTGISQFKLYENAGASTNDYFQIKCAANGAATILTLDAGGANGSLDIKPDGNLQFTVPDAEEDNINFNVVGAGNRFAALWAESENHSTFIMYEMGGASTADYFKIHVGEEGETIISTVDGNAQAARLTIQADGDLLLRPYNAGIKIEETASAGADTGTYGQVWVKSDTPNILCFTDDAGTDIEGIGKYQYTTQVVNYAASQAGSFIPLGGYVIERTGTSSYNEYIAMVAPYNGTLERIVWRSEAAQDGTMQMDIYESADGTEPPASVIGTKDSVIDIADDTALIVDFASMTSGTNALVKGRIYAIKIISPSNSYDTNTTLVWKWDILS